MTQLLRHCCNRLKTILHSIYFDFTSLHIMVTGDFGDEHPNLQTWGSCAYHHLRQVYGPFWVLTQQITVILRLCLDLVAREHPQDMLSPLCNHLRGTDKDDWGRERQRQPLWPQLRALTPRGSLLAEGAWRRGFGMTSPLQGTEKCSFSAPFHRVQVSN